MIAGQLRQRLLCYPKTIQKPTLKLPSFVPLDHKFCRRFYLVVLGERLRFFLSVLQLIGGVDRSHYALAAFF